MVKGLPKKFYKPLGILLILAGLFAGTYPLLSQTNPGGRFTAPLTGGCEETDYGKDPFTFGKVTSSVGLAEVKVDADYCKSTDQLVEFYCDKGISKSAVVSCSFYNGVCSNGLCVIGQ